ncbi:hypothetical protein E3N88_38765 [Mikania micrantha]|uniref:Reverse transcriptase Ty1/copia-type domain-containing protein n=1 Tax=Mikania micrantha TaxID=192012 RepID=A0A5N6LUX2_9ASTR|nr:hypothetical protein E3N88_38765 [Mikania micrantha]
MKRVENKLYESFGKPTDEFDDYLLEDLPDDLTFEGLAEDMVNAGFHDMFQDVRMGFVFDSILDKELEEIPSTSLGASNEDENEDILLGNVSTNPYLDNLYALKKTAPKVQQNWIPSNKGDDIDDPEYLYSASSQDIYALCNDKSRVVCWSYSSENQLYLVKRFNCATYQANPKASHLIAVKRIFRYLVGKPRLGLWYLQNSEFRLFAYSNSDFCGCNLNMKSTTGGCQYLGDRLVSWQCKKQTTVSTSTAEAGYVAASSCCSQVIWMQ